MSGYCERCGETICVCASAQSRAGEAGANLTDELAANKRDAERYRWLRERLLGADFDWNENGITVLAFEFPRNVGIGGNCDKNIDAAMAANV